MVRFILPVLVLLMSPLAGAEDTGPCTHYPEKYCYGLQEYYCTDAKKSVEAKIMIDSYGQEGVFLQFTSKLWVNSGDKKEFYSRDRVWVDWTKLPPKVQQQYKDIGLWIDTGWVYKTTTPHRVDKGHGLWNYDLKRFKYYLGTTKNEDVDYNLWINLRNNTVKFSKYTREGNQDFSCKPVRFK